MKRPVKCGRPGDDFSNKCGAFHTFLGSFYLPENPLICLVLSFAVPHTTPYTAGRVENTTSMSPDESIDCYRTPSRRPSVCRTGAPPRSISIRTRTLTERERRRDFLILYEAIIWEGNEKKTPKNLKGLLSYLVGAKVAISSLTSNKQPPCRAVAIAMSHPLC